MSKVVELRPGSHHFKKLHDLASLQPDRQVHLSTAQRLGFNPEAIKHLSSPEGFVHADKVMEHINSMPSIKLDNPGHALNSDSYQLEAHREKFDPKAYGLDRNNFVDTDRAFDRHMANFDSSDISEKDYDDTPDEIERYDAAVNKAREEHATKFNPKDWSSHDSLLKPEYFVALDNAQKDHDSKFKNMPLVYE